MKKLLCVLLLSTTMSNLSFVKETSAYSQDPRSCSDRRTRYPSNPPCNQNLNINI